MKIISGIYSANKRVAGGNHHKGTVTNVANSTDSIKIRILDEKGNIVLNDLLIDAGTTIDIKGLENNTYYTVEILADNGWYMLNLR